MNRESLRTYLLNRLDTMLTGWVLSRFLTKVDIQVLQAERIVIAADDGTLLDKILAQLRLTGTEEKELLAVTQHLVDRGSLGASPKKKAASRSAD